MTPLAMRYGRYRPMDHRRLRLRPCYLHGTDVAVVQALYNRTVHLVTGAHGPMGLPVVIDGVFGPETRQAIHTLQAYFGLRADGVVGPATYFVWGHGVDGWATYTGSAYGRRRIGPRDRGGDVMVLQNGLNCLGYATVLGHPATGSMDAGTHQAMQAFRHVVTQTGYQNLEASAAVAAAWYEATWLFTTAGGRNVLPGRHGLDVAWIQRQLQRLGYYTGWWTGRYDAATGRAIRDF